MKILIDCSNLQAGGGIQVALSFINDLIKLNRQERFIILMSPQIALSLKEIIHLGNFQFIELNKKYYKNIFVRGRIIKKIESEIRPNIIFTVFGPSYHKSNFPKIVGFGIGHILYPKSPYFKKIDSLSRFKINFVNSLKKHFFIKNSDALIFYT